MDSNGDASSVREQRVDMLPPGKGKYIYLLLLQGAGAYIFREYTGSLLTLKAVFFSLHLSRQSFYTDLYFCALPFVSKEN